MPTIYGLADRPSSKRSTCYHHLSLVPYYYPTRQRLCYTYSLTDQTIAPIRLRSNNQLIDQAPNIQPLSPPNAHTVLLPESGNCCANIPLIPIMVVLISLQPIKKELPEDRQELMPIRLRNQPYTGTALPHTINKLIAPLCLLLQY